MNSAPPPPADGPAAATMANGPCPDAARRNVSWRSGEFLDPVTERLFDREGISETLRHGRRLLVASAILNALFFISDWRFHGTPQFWIAIPARTFVIAGSLVALASLGRVRTPRGATIVLAGWVATTAIGVTALVSSHSELALFVVLLLPLIFYLAVPLPFVMSVASGTGASAMLLAGYAERHDSSLPGLVLALLTLNCCLALVVLRSNRLRRLEWQATRHAREAAAALAASQQILHTTFAAAPVPMVVSRAADGCLLQVNDSCVAMFGITPEMIGSCSIERFYADPTARERLMALLRRDGQVSDFETLATCADGKTRTVLIKAALVDMATGPTIIAGLIDISDRKAVEMSLEWLASTDPLTKLPNRLSFFSTARAEMLRATRSGKPLALLMLDLDHFKAINDTFGHQGGDRVLQAFGRICVDRLRGADIVGRLGGEEFGVLLPDTDAERALIVAEDLRIALAELRLAAPFADLRATASIGITLTKPADTHLDIALARADRALYVAKRAGRNRVHVDPQEHPAGLRAAG